MARTKQKFHSITFKINEADLAELKKRVMLSGFNQTEYILFRLLRSDNNEAVMLKQAIYRKFYVNQKLLMSVLFELTKNKKLVTEYVDRLIQEADEISRNEEVFS